jgi:hypothetical protein
MHAEKHTGPSGKPHPKSTKEERHSVILADDECGRRANPATHSDFKKSVAATDHASDSHRVSTVTDGEAG